MSDIKFNPENAPERRASEASASPEQIRASLEKVLQSDGFEGTSRLREFLSYVVLMTLSDPAAKIPAKAIAQDLYGRSIESGADNVNVVRVDAGRLRRRLSAYYAGPGRDDPVIIHVDSGGYTPRFEVRNVQDDSEVSAAESTDGPHSRRIGSALASLVLLATLGIGIAIGYFLAPGGDVADQLPSSTTDQTNSERELERQALMAKSPSSLQAVTLANQARTLIFPLIELEQLQRTLAMFRQAIKKDESYFGGYAGAAQSLATMAVFSPNGPVREGLLLEAQQMQTRAVELAPTDPWTQSALAWTAYVSGDLDESARHSEIAVGLAPNDGNVLDFHAFLMLCIGDFEAARLFADPDRERNAASGPYANLGIHGAASFHLGLYDDAISSLLRGSFAGDPFAAPTLAYLASSHQAQGNDEEARRYARKLQSSWPEFRADVMLARLYLDPAQAKVVQDRLHEAGWKDENASFPDTRDAD